MEPNFTVLKRLKSYIWRLILSSKKMTNQGIAKIAKVEPKHEFSRNNTNEQLLIPSHYLPRIYIRTPLIFKSSPLFLRIWFYKYIKRILTLANRSQISILVLWKPKGNQKMSQSMHEETVDFQIWWQHDKLKQIYL